MASKPAYFMDPVRGESYEPKFATVHADGSIPSTFSFFPDGATTYNTTISDEQRLGPWSLCRGSISCTAAPVSSGMANLTSAQCASFPEQALVSHCHAAPAIAPRRGRVFATATSRVLPPFLSAPSPYGAPPPGPSFLPASAGSHAAPSMPAPIFGLPAPIYSSAVPIGIAPTLPSTPFQTGTWPRLSFNSVPRYQPTAVPRQKRAISFVENLARKEHYRSLPLLQARALSLGWHPNDLNKCLQYLGEEAPIIIHLTEATLTNLIHDTHYRNLFETNTTGGCHDMAARQAAESAMFGNCYDHYHGDPFDLPKYGCLNVTGDIEGVQCARVYGNCFLILHQHVRPRCTFYDKDTLSSFWSSQDRILGTSKYNAHIVNGYSDDDLRAAMNASGASSIGGSRSSNSIYKEVQIHGPVCLATDVQALSVPGHEALSSPQLLDDVHAFQRKTGCNILWQGDLLTDDSSDG